MDRARRAVQGAARWRSVAKPGAAPWPGAREASGQWWGPPGERSAAEAGRRPPGGKLPRAARREPTRQMRAVVFGRGRRSLPCTPETGRGAPRSGRADVLFGATLAKGDAGAPEHMARASAPDWEGPWPRPALSAGPQLFPAADF
jgi:hypothetical protein